MVVQSDDFFRPSKFVNHALTTRMRARPQFQICDSVIISDTVDVVSVFFRTQGAPNRLAEHKPVFKRPPVLAMSERAMYADLDQNVTKRCTPSKANINYGSMLSYWFVGLHRFRSCAVGSSGYCKGPPHS